MKIMKFGGTSVGSPQRMNALIDLINDGESKIVVLSAMSGTTNALADISQALYQKDNEKAGSLIVALEEKYKKVITELYFSEQSLEKGRELISTHFDYLKSFTRDLFTINEERAVLAQGELISTALFQFLLEEKGIPSVLLPALNFMRLNENAEPDMALISENLKLELLKYPGSELFITQGYISRNDFGEIDNLKRGGSDYTATIVGAAIGADEIQIWTDIDGMHNNDPRVVNKTFPIAKLTFDEAAELAYFGAKILHPTCILPAKDQNIPVRLLNTMQPEAPGTLISSENQSEGFRAVAAKDGITAINIKSGRMLMAYGFLRAVFEVFERYRKPIDMITTSEVAVSVTVDNTDELDTIVEELNEFGTVKVDTDLSIVSIVGLFPAAKPGYAGAIFDTLRNIPVRMISYGGSENNISILVDTKLKKQTLMELNKGLFNLE
ncbi:MAG: aspartate kinase [Bacteroidales bacterium]|nr:aspartate kinase [Bacteroidales bacterium]